MKEIRHHIDTITGRAAKDAGIETNEEARRELASHLFDLASNRAEGRALTIHDVNAAWADLAPKAIYLLRDEPSERKRTVRRAASWTRRLAAYLADATIILSSIVIGTLAFGEYVADPDEIAIVLFIFLMMAIHLILTSLEVRRGATPGKLLFNLRTVDEGGQAPSWPAAWLITLPKVFPPLLALDVILGVVSGARDRVRATERFVGLRVIKVN